MQLSVVDMTIGPMDLRCVMMKFHDDESPSNGHICNIFMPNTRII